jgi:hypothetical protein
VNGLLPYVRECGLASVEARAVLAGKWLKDWREINF